MSSDPLVGTFAVLHILRLLLTAASLASAATAVAMPVTYSYFGTITSSLGYPGVNAGDAISITVTYDLTNPPPEFSTVSDGTTYAGIEVANGRSNWAIWMSVVARFDGYIWQNDMTSGNANDAIRYIEDGALSNIGAGCCEDSYTPFYVRQSADIDNTDEKSGYWRIRSFSSGTNPDLTNGLSFPQAIDLTKGDQFGGVFTRDRAGNQFVSFVLNQIDVRIPEPGSLSLLGLGLAGLAASRRRKVQ